MLFILNKKIVSIIIKLMQPQQLHTKNQPKLLAVLGISNISSALNAENKLNELNKAKWYYDWQGTRYESNLSNKDLAIQEIIRKIENQYDGVYPASVSTIYGTIKHYAKGTRNSDSLAITQEDGFEAIFGKLQNGEYTMMPQGSQVFNSDMTNNLWNFSSDPQKFMSDATSKMSGFLSARYGDISDGLGSVTNKVTKFGGDVSFNPTSNYNIYGNVDNTALNNVKKQEQKLYEKYKKHYNYY